ncbi:MAG: mannitol dehydrogenase family protein [Lachnospiraceae bacterium]|nr:mannitol dehydrogenase family protein [Lachnospiraceae bacterium]
MKLTLNDITGNASEWKAAGVKLPEFDVANVVANTKANPTWIHFGAGNIFRGFVAELQQVVLDKGEADTGIIAADTFDYEIIDKIYNPFDNLTLFVGLKPDGNTENKIIASVCEALHANCDEAESFARMKEIFSNKGLQMVSFTITEKGYSLYNMNGELLPVVIDDIECGPDKPKHAMSVVTAMLYERFNNGAAPVALVSMDNCSHNGEKLYESVSKIATAWKEKGYVTDSFIEYINDESKVSFPWSMIDKITPRPAKVIEDMLGEKGIEDMIPVTTSRGTYIAPFVNAEIPQYLVIEDKFPNGRPRLELAGVYFTDRDTVNDTERMKVTTCLNPLHTALAVYGCLLGYTSISAEMKDESLKKLVEHIGYDEGIPVVTDPGILSPMDFIKEVIDERLPNPFVPDMPQRIATDTSQKVPVRFGETIKSYIESDALDVTTLTYIPLAIAGWLRYLLAIDDNGNNMELSSDPMLNELQKALEGITFGQPETVGDKLSYILSNSNLFGTDLCAAGLSDKITDMFTKMIAGPGAVRETLDCYVK